MFKFAFMSMLLALLPALSMAEPPAVNTQSRKIKSDPPVGTAKNLKKDPGVAKPANLKKDPGVAAKKAGAKSDDVLAVQNSGPAGGGTSTGTATGTDTGANTAGGGSITGVTSMKALVAADSVGAPITTGATSTTNSAQSMQMLAMALAMMKNGAPMSAEDQQAQLIAVAEKANGITSTPLGSSPTIYINPGCRKCMEAASNDPRFQSCNSFNGYLEDQLDDGKMAPEKNEPKRANVTCIAESIRGSSMSNIFYCPQAGGNGSRPRYRACASETLVKRLAQAFEDVSGCLGDYVVPSAQSDQAIQEDFQRAMFQIVNHESAFTPNVVSNTAAAGLGQLTKGAIEEINTSEFTGAMNHIRASKKPACQRLAKVPYDRMSPTENCSAMSLNNGNPELNLIYSALHMKMVRNQVEGTVDSMGTNFSSREARENFINDMSIWGHNVGVNGLNKALATVLQTNSSSLASGDKKGFYNALATRIFVITPPHPKNRNRPAEASSFFGKTEKDLERIEQKANGKCGV